ncbi:Type 1 glutamine amidotransferase-like domain-containing protein [Pendulispora brunnea]|uniref:Type 1 glutamine amidotransferase-like domain-containing protein n=1 Tax=Pendulispora brunnea TaxID=2905690 RepID=A0ABZ2K6G5_9BACT
MRALLTSSGIKNSSIQGALVNLLGKPIAESNALFIPTAIYPFPGGAGMAYRAICGKGPTPLCELGWKSLGVLELTALPTIEKAAWVPAVRDADALLVGGGDPLFLANWMRRSGLTDLLPTLRSEAVYVGVSAGSIVAAAIFVETYTEPPRGNDRPLKTEDIVFTSPRGDVKKTLVTGQGLGLVDFAVIPHLEHPEHADASLANAEKWAARIPAPTYAIDDDTAISVVDGDPQVVSEGQWKLFQPEPAERHVIHDESGFVDEAPRSARS